MDKVTAFRYRRADSPLHKRGAGIKLVGLALVSVCAMAGDWLGLALAASALIAAALVGRINPRLLYAGFKPLAILALMVMIFRCFGSEAEAADSVVLLFGLSASITGFLEGLRFALGLALTYMSGAVLFISTTTLELRAALDRAQKRVSSFLIGNKPPSTRKGHVSSNKTKRAISRSFRETLARLIAAWDLPLLFALTLSFLPRIFQLREELDEAWRSRGGKRGFRALGFTLPKLLERLLEYTAENAWALESRGYKRQALAVMETGVNTNENATRACTAQNGA